MPRNASDADTLIIGAVAYDPKVVTIWEGFKAYFAGAGLAADHVLFSNYERQVEANLDGSIDVAWNSPLAWVRARRLAEARGVEVHAGCMRDTDRDLTSAVVVRWDSPASRVEDLRGARIAVGAVDSPQATLLPMAFLKARGLSQGDVTFVYQDLLAGKHGDHGAAERSAARALVAGEVDAACVLGGNPETFAAEGVIPPGSIRILEETPRFDHCNFTVGPSAPPHLVERFRQILLGMSYQDPEVRPLFDLEGLQAWVDGRLEGYGDLEDAVDDSGFYDRQGRVIASNYAP